MYTCATLVYGFPVEIDFDQYYESVDQDYVRELENKFEEQAPGFIQDYAGNSEIDPRAFGIVLDNFDECNPVKISSLNLTATEEIKEEFKEIYNSLSEQLQHELKQFEKLFGEPQVFILWTTS